MVIPVLGILLIGILVVRERYLVQQHAASEARRCAWQHALAGCPDAPPRGCDAPNAHADADAVAQGERLMSHAQAASSSTLDVFAEVPLLGNAFKGLLGSTTRFSMHAGARAPWLKTTNITKTTKLVTLCNETPHTGSEVAKIVMNSMTDF